MFGPGVSIRTELLAGATTWLTMAYIVVVNPSILAVSGIDPGAAFVATCLAAAIGSAAMGLFANGCDPKLCALKPPLCLIRRDGWSWLGPAVSRRVLSNSPPNRHSAG